MASKITLTFLIVITLALLAVSYFLIKQEKEGFENAQNTYSVNNLTIKTCPSFAPAVHTAIGNDDCCPGDFIDQKCTKIAFCTTSDPKGRTDGVPSCQEAWRTYFSDKGKNICPPTMPNYFEDVSDANAAKGCSAGPIQSDGKMPTDGTMKQCKIYRTEEENLTKEDSCAVEKGRTAVQCPVVNGNSPEARTRYFPYFKAIYYSCEYPPELGMPDMCAEKNSYFAFLDKAFGSAAWRSGNSSDWANSNTCENYITRRQNMQAEANRLQAEQKAREQAEADRAAAEAAANKAAADLKKQMDENSRLQTLLDEANRKAQACNK